MNTQEIVAKLWNLCNVLRDDGITYHQYVTELTYILFLKMAKETGVEKNIPEAYRWDNLVNKSGIELKNFYKELLDKLGTNTTGRIREIYQGSATNIEEPKNLEKIIKTIDELDWYSAKEEGLGNLYEGLLEKNANEKKSGAGQYFTPRVLIDVIVELVNLPFGTKKGGERATRDDFTYPTSNKQLNFLQHIYRSLKANGKARAGVVLPDNVLFADGDGEKIRADLMDKCNLHTILRLPTGIFYAQGVKTNVLFFTRGKTDKDNTKEVWFYDLRTNMPSFGKTNPLKKSDFADFIKAYTAEDRHKIQDERFSVFTREQIAEKGNSLDLGLIKDDSILDYEDLPNPIDCTEEMIADLSEAQALLSEVVNELKSLENGEA